MVRCQIGRLTTALERLSSRCRCRCRCSRCTTAAERLSRCFSRPRPLNAAESNAVCNHVALETTTMAFSARGLKHAHPKWANSVEFDFVSNLAPGRETLWTHCSQATASGPASGRLPRFLVSPKKTLKKYQRVTTMRRKLLAHSQRAKKQRRRAAS